MSEARFVKLLIVTFIFSIVCLPLPAYALIQSDNVLESRPVAEGLVLEKHSVGAGGGKTLLYVLRANISNPYLKVNTIVGSDGTLAKNARVADMAVDSGAVAAVNADFFQLGESGRPIGMTYKDGRLVTSPPLRSDMYGWGVTKDGKALIDLFAFSGRVTAANGQSFTLSGINKPLYYVGGDDSAPVTSHQDALLMYDRCWGDTSRGCLGSGDNVTEVFVSGGTVREILVNQVGQRIPDNGFVLAGRGKAADFIKADIKVGDKISVDFSVTPGGNDLWAGTGGWSLLVDGGKAKSSFPSSINGPLARTAIGYTPDRKNIIVVVAEKSSISRGLTLEELAEYIAGLKVERALDLDGGGSTTLAVRPLGEDGPVLMNRPQNGAQRPVPTALGFFSSAPRGNLAGLIIKGSDFILPDEEVSFTLKGYDVHYNPVSIDKGGVSWSVVSGPGSFANNVFKSGTGGLAVISASFGGLTRTMPVKVMGPDDFSRLVADPSTISVQPGKSVAVSVKAVGKDGTVYDLTDTHYSVTVDKQLGTYQNGTFTGSENVSSGEMTLTFDGLSVTVPVTVKNDGQAVLSYTPGQPGQLKLDNFVLNIPGSALSKPVCLTASYDGEVSALVPERYKMISSVIIQAANGDTATLANPAIVKWIYPAGDSERVTVLQLIGGKWLDLPSVVDEKECKVSCPVNSLGLLALVRDTRPPAVFTDMKGHWAEEVVSRLAGAGIVSGYPGNIFGPSRQVTRAEFAVMLGKAFGWGQASGRAGFRDEGSIEDWARGYVIAAYQKGIISGYEDHTFRPGRQVTRAEMAAMVCKALSLKVNQSFKPENFKDWGNMDKWARGPVSAVCSAGLMKGDNENRFRAKDRATRAESAVLMDNVMNYLYE